MHNNATLSPTESLTQTLKGAMAFFNVDPVITSSQEGSVVKLEIKTTNDDLFIGRNADPLLALQHLMRVIAKREFPDQEISVSLNIGGFHQQQEANIEELAKNAAAQARSTNTAVHLPSMTSYERRLIHVALANETDIVTESEGEGPTRAVVVRLK